MEIDLHEMDLPAVLEAVRYGALRTIGRDRSALQGVALQIECEIERLKEDRPRPDPIHRRHYSRLVAVRDGFDEESIWRRALGGSEPLLVQSTDGPIDAPEHIPTGGHRLTGFGSIRRTE